MYMMSLGVKEACKLTTREKSKRVLRMRKIMGRSHSPLHIKASALLYVVSVSLSKFQPRFRPLDSVVNLAAKCNRIDWSYFAATD